MLCTSLWFYQTTGYVYQNTCNAFQWAILVPCCCNLIYFWYSTRDQFDIKTIVWMRHLMHSAIVLTPWKRTIQNSSWKLRSLFFFRVLLSIQSKWYFDVPLLNSTNHIAKTSNKHIPYWQWYICSKHLHDFIHITGSFYHQYHEFILKDSTLKRKLYESLLDKIGNNCMVMLNVRSSK